VRLPVCHEDTDEARVCDNRRDREGTLARSCAIVMVESATESSHRLLLELGYEAQTYDVATPAAPRPNGSLTRLPPGGRRQAGSESPPIIKRR